MKWILRLPVLVIAACAEIEPVVETPPMPVVDTCGAAPHSNLIGQDSTALERVLIMREVRVIRDGRGASVDIRPQRINFHIGPMNEIYQISCG